MAKTIVKYLTKPTDEILQFIINFNNEIDEDDLYKKVKDFLSDRSNFAMIIYAYGKISGVAMFSLDSEHYRIKLGDVYLKEANYLSDILNYMTYRFVNYRLIIHIDSKNKPLLSIIKKSNFTEDGEGNYIISF